ncbi:raffinose/stachyose/melibiose transport system substrate-binding protein [Catenulispora sp. MAP12-49]|uniref:ABC transporter substrate-binding protein n=1 Tax=unclassified Catenulispora TaxID=414885 RepID=UPI00351554BC
MRNKAFVTLGVLAATAALTVSACSSSKSSGSTGSNGSGGQVTLKVVGWKGGTAEPAHMKEINAAFEAAHPNVKIDYTFAPSSAYTQKLNAEFLGGTAEDVVMASTADAPRWAKSGYVADLSDQPWVSDLSAPVKPLATVQGKVIAEPNELTGIGLFSNMKLLKAAGIDKAPATWSELISDLQALKKAGQPGLALPDKSGWTVYAAINATAASNVFAANPTWTDDLVSGKATFAADAGWKKSVQQVLDLGSQGLIDYKAQLGVDEWSQGTQDFKAGKSAFLLQGSWSMSDLAKGVDQLQFSPWPGGEAADAPMATTAVGTMWTINAATKHKAEAEEYLKFWAASDNLTQYLSAEAAVSPFKSVSTPAIPGAEAFISAVGAGHFWVLPENGWAGGKAQTAMTSASQALLLGQASVDKTLAAYDAAAKG